MVPNSVHPRGAIAVLLPLVVLATGCGSDGPAEPVLLDESSIVVTPANGEIGAVTEIVVSALGSDGRPWTGGLALSGEVSGTNEGATVTTGDLGGGDYAVRYTPSALGLDTVTILRDGTPLPMSPVPSRVRIVFRAGTGSPTIDGTLATGEWGDAQAYDVLSGPLVGSTVQFLTDDTNLYIAVRYAGTEPTRVVTVRFDNLVDLEVNGDDGFNVLSNFATPFQDFHFAPNEEFIEDAVAHGAGAATVVAGFGVFEARRPLSSGDAQDFSLSPGDSVGVCLRVQTSLTNNASDFTFPSNCVFAFAAQRTYAELILP